MTHLYDTDVRFYMGVGKYSLLITENNTDVDIGKTIMTIDLHERGCNISTISSGINPRVSALALTYCEMIKKEMADIIELSDEEFGRWADMAAGYKELGVEYPLSAAYGEVKMMINKQSQPDTDKDRDVC